MLFCYDIFIFFCIIIQKIQLDTLNHDFFSSHRLISACLFEYLKHSKGQRLKRPLYELPATLQHPRLSVNIFYFVAYLVKSEEYFVFFTLHKLRFTHNAINFPLDS
jgi:hypothetical protein